MIATWRELATKYLTVDRTKAERYARLADQLQRIVGDPAYTGEIRIIDLTKLRAVAKKRVRECLFFRCGYCYQRDDGSCEACNRPPVKRRGK